MQHRRPPSPRATVRLAALAAATVAALTALSAAPPLATAATTPPQLKTSMPTPDPRVERLAIEVRCRRACVLRLDRIGLVRYGRGGPGSGQQLPFGADVALRAPARRIPAGRATVVQFDLPPAASRFAAASVADGEVVRGDISATVQEGGDPPLPVVETITIHLGHVPAGESVLIDDIVVPQGIGMRPRRATLYAVTIRGTQESSWSYRRDAPRGADCTTVDNGSGQQTISFRSKAPVRARVMRDSRGWTVLVKPGSDFLHVYVPLLLEGRRDGVRNAGVSGTCGGVPAGGEGGGGTPQECTRTGSMEHPAMLYTAGTKDELSAFVSHTAFDTRATDRPPTCPVELPTDARTDLEPLGVAIAGFGRRIGRAPRTLTLDASASDTRQIPGGSVRTRARWTITFKAVG